MLTIHTATEAAEVLSAAHHRGLHWHFDAERRRVLPAEWNLLGEEPIAFTQFEAVTLARGLAEIGAVRLVGDVTQ